jgi:hypothetical protein
MVIMNENPAVRTRLQKKSDRARTSALIRELAGTIEADARNNLRSELGTRIRTEFPSVPRKVLKEMVDYYTDPNFRSPHRDEQGLHGEWRDKTFNLVKAWVRHQMTDYDQILAATGRGGAQNKKAARQAVDGSVREIMRSWRKKSVPSGETNNDSNHEI